MMEASEWMGRARVVLDGFAKLKCLGRDEPCLVCQASELTRVLVLEGLSPAQWARNTGVSKSTVLNWLRARVLAGVKSEGGRWVVTTPPNVLNGYAWCGSCSTWMAMSAADGECQACVHLAHAEPGSDLAAEIAEYKAPFLRSERGL